MKTILPDQTYKMLVKSEQGFTLLEIIVSLIVAAILGTMLVTITGSALQRSSQPIEAIQRTYAMELVMENINLYYFNLLYNPTEIHVLNKLSIFINANYTDFINTADDMKRYTSFSSGVLSSPSVNGPIMRLTLTDSSTGITLTSLFYDRGGISF